MRVSVGVFIFSKQTKRILYVMRTEARTAGTWGIPGGKFEQGETLSDAIKRECHEELGITLEGKLIPIQKFTNSDFTYHTLFHPVGTEFVPKLNNEHCAYCWMQHDVYPSPLHPGLFSTLKLETVQTKMAALVSLC
jgi:8-oxo-dGTP pyrophosphatase MutT (NUDIX family)